MIRSNKAPENLNTRLALESEVALENFVPYSSHYDRNTLKTFDDQLVRIFEVRGVSFETASNLEINKWHSHLHQMYMNNIDSDVSFWAHIIKEEDDHIALSQLNTPFSKRLDKNYKEKLSKEKYYIFSLFITVVVKSNLKLPMFTERFLDRESFLSDAKDKLDNISSYIDKLEHEPRILTVYKRDGRNFSEPLAFISRLVSGYWREIPLTKSRANTLVCNSRVLIGRETIEIRSPTDNMYCASLGLKDYMTPTNPLMFSQILSLPFPFVLSQSFVPIAQQDSVNLLNKHLRMMKASNDPAISQVAELEIAKDDVASRRICMGEHNFSLFIYTDAKMILDEKENEITVIKRQIKDRVSYTLRVLGDTGSIAVREDLALPAQYFAMLPGNHRYRARISTISSANFCSFFPMHSVPNGRWGKKHWQDTVMPLQTRMGTIYDFNFHLDGTDLGHTLIFGASTAGKTVLQTMLISQSEKFNPKTIYFDKDRGAEIFIRAVDGHYEVLRRGVKTGFNPYQMPVTKENLDFLTRFTLKLIHPKDDYSASTQNQVDETIRRFLTDSNKPKELRTLSELNRHFQDQDIRERLLRWTDGKQHGWLFDNPIDNFKFDASVIGIDTTEFLDDQEIATPIFLYFTHRLKECYGNRLLLFFDEFWKMLGDPVFKPWIKDELKTIRKKNGVFVGATQDADDVLNSDICSTLLGQCPTRCFLPNFEAKKESYQRFNITDVEFEFIKNSNPKNREFILKYGHDSIVVNMDLAGMNDELAVLSGRESNIHIMESCIAESSNKPADWLPLYLNRYSNE